MPTDTTVNTAEANYLLPKDFLLNFYAAIQGEAEGQDKELKKLFASAYLNRIGKKEWADSDLNTLLVNTFDAAKLQNNPYRWALSGNFPNKISEDDFKETIAAIAPIIKSGKIPYDVEFVMTKKRYKQIKKMSKSKRPLNLDLLKPTVEVGDFIGLKYK
ncbi:MAG TPA: hypothetical protein ENL45_02130 [Candidatus Woesearchaeota archaeon]|nr:hypothetical protein [Candidatus Woesearchaeota archaeon]